MDQEDWEPTTDSAPGPFLKLTAHTGADVVWGIDPEARARLTSSVSFVGFKNLWQRTLDG